MVVLLQLRRMTTTTPLQNALTQKSCRKRVGDRLYPGRPPEPAVHRGLSSGPRGCSWDGCRRVRSDGKITHGGLRIRVSVRSGTRSRRWQWAHIGLADVQLRPRGAPHGDVGAHGWLFADRPFRLCVLRAIESGSVPQFLPSATEMAWEAALPIYVLWKGFKSSPVISLDDGVSAVEPRMAAI